MFTFDPAATQAKLPELIAMLESVGFSADTAHHFFNRLEEDGFITITGHDVESKSGPLGEVIRKKLLVYDDIAGLRIRVLTAYRENDLERKRINTVRDMLAFDFRAENESIDDDLRSSVLGL